MPLMIRGARQVGKSYTITEFGESEFENFITINFEQQPEYKNCFSTLVPKEIISSISILAMSDIIPAPNRDVKKILSERKIFLSTSA